ncbi:hypothetical protein HOK51_04955 [Candidatus Woesearchaeota archaeon]|jgi:hypothetical protein|nr:hypothetical protein [Candidatus Woesearchaeota archaeon]MBT6519175.1 hypothetical protein [Candidatus Woesearchaeota archaeon]MBT7368672.1 hypothetical protein [Candidatus Woesearchaeota archaeon]
MTSLAKLTKREATQEFKKLMQKKSYHSLIHNTNYVSKLETVLIKQDYSKIELEITKGHDHQGNNRVKKSNIYKRINKDKSIDVLVTVEIPRITTSLVNNGYSHIKFENDKKYEEFKSLYEYVIGYTSHLETTGSAIIGGMSGAAMGGAIAGCACIFGGFAPIVIAYAACAGGTGVGLIGRIKGGKEAKKYAEKIELLEKIKDKSVVGKMAISRALENQELELSL